MSSLTLDRRARTATIASMLLAFALLFLAFPASRVEAATGTRLVASLGGGTYGSVTLSSSTTTGPLRLALALKSYKANGSYSVILRRGGCSSLGSVVMRSPGINTSSDGKASRTTTFTASQTTKIRAGLKAGSVSIVVGTRCGTFARPSTVGASRTNPVPLGKQARVGDWLVTVTGVYPDASADVLAANMFNSPPAEGRQFFMVAVSATYVGTGSTKLDSSYGMRAVGASNVAYSTFGDSCGVLPAPNLSLDNPEVFEGGTVAGNAACWSIVSGDASSLVMYFEPFLSSSRVWFALR